MSYLEAGKKIFYSTSAYNDKQMYISLKYKHHANPAMTQKPVCHEQTKFRWINSFKINSVDGSHAKQELGLVGSGGKTVAFCVPKAATGGLACLACILCDGHVTDNLVSGQLHAFSHLPLDILSNGFSQASARFGLIFQVFHEELQTAKSYQLGLAGLEALVRIGLHFVSVLDLDISASDLNTLSKGGEASFEDHEIMEAHGRTTIVHGSTVAPVAHWRIADTSRVTVFLLLQVSLGRVLRRLQACVGERRPHNPS